jgi:hypothetical protein
MMFDRSHSAIKGVTLGTYLLFGLAVAGPASAQVLNPDFQNSAGTIGSLADYTLDGNNQIQSGAIKSGPSNPMVEHFQVLIQNSDTPTYSAGGNTVAPGTADDNAAHFETFVGVSSANFTALVPIPPGPNPPVQQVQGGSAIQQTVTLNVGDKITFDYDFLANGANGLNTMTYAPYPNTTDIAFVHITDGTANTLSLLGDTTTDANLFNANGQTPVSDPFLYQTATNNGQDYLTYTFTAPQTGSYTISIGDTYDGGGVVGLLVDNFTFTPGTMPPPTTPEPGAVATMGGLLISGTVFLRRRKRA